MSALATGPTPSAAESGEEHVESWITDHGDELRRHLGRMLGNDADAEDVLQEVWIKAYSRPPDQGPGSNVRAWLYKVATNAALDRLARDRRRSSALCGKSLKVAPEPLDQPGDGLLGASEDTRARVRDHVAKLPTKQREAVWLRWVEGLDYEVIAARLGSSKAAARANVYNGMKRLRVELFELWKKENLG